MSAFSVMLWLIFGLDWWGFGMVDSCNFKWRFDALMPTIFRANLFSNSRSMIIFRHVLSPFFLHVFTEDPTKQTEKIRSSLILENQVTILEDFNQLTFLQSSYFLENSSHWKEVAKHLPYNVYIQMFQKWIGLVCSQLWLVW
jgi:hypothetical protein